MSSNFDALFHKLEDLRAAARSLVSPLDVVVGSVLSFAFDGPNHLGTPAAKGKHHAHPGGLLDHTLGVLNLVNVAAICYPWLNLDVLRASAILHDLGKTREYANSNGATAVTEVGHLWGAHQSSGRVDQGRHAP